MPFCIPLMGIQFWSLYVVTYLAPQLKGDSTDFTHQNQYTRHGWYYSAFKKNQSDIKWKGFNEKMLFSSIMENVCETRPIFGTKSLEISRPLLLSLGPFFTNIHSDISPMLLPFSQLQRNILASNPRVTRFHINWEGLADKMEDSENVDPSPNISGMLPPSCLPGKMPPLGLMPDNSMDCM